MISRRAPLARKGAALGIYSSSQFLGGFVGAKLGGYALGHWGTGSVFAVAAVLSAVWLSFAVGVRPIVHEPQTGETTAV
jgi:predicted MFS family arabinose efflux permease